MFKPGSFRHLSIHFTQVGALWALGVLLVSISLLGILSRADAPAPFASPRHASEAQSGASPSAQSIAPGVFISPLAASEATPPLASQAKPTATPKPTAEPLIEAAWPADGATNVSPQMPLVIQFRGEVNPRAIEQALWILPQTEGEFTWDDQFMQFAPKGGWARGVTYRISLTRGRSLLAPEWTFKVKSLVRATTPRQHGRLSWGDDVRITFAEPMDHASVEAAFSISPEMPGELRWEDTTLVFTPGDQWLPGTDYTLILDSSLKTAAGEQPLRAPYQLSFSTAHQTGTLSFGYGPNVQIVNPDGRRAVQFEASGNLESMTVRLHMLTVEQFLDRYTSSFRGVGPAEDKHVDASDLPVVREWRQAIDTTRDRYTAQELTLPSDLSPGLYVLTLNHPAVLTDELIVVYTHDTLVLKQAEGHIATWASALGGGPLDDMRVRIYDRDATLVAEGQTGAQGLFVTQVPIDPQPLIVIGERDGEITASGLSNEWEQNSWNWWWQPAPKANRTRAYIYTDRPIYRPGQTVHVKVAARYDNDAVYSRIPLEWDVIVRLRDARDNVVAAQTLHVNEYGTLNTSFELAEGGTVGTYHVETQIKDEVQRQAIKVEEYRKPEYEVTVHTDRDNLVRGEPVSVTIEARTYFGAPLANARIELATYQRQDEWWWYSSEQDAGGVWSPLEGKRSGTTDANGRWTLDLTPQVRDYQYDDYRHSVTALIEASVQDDTGSSVSAHAQVIVHDAKFGLNVALPRHAYKPDQDIPVTVFARDIDGLPRADEPIVAEILGWGAATASTNMRWRMPKVELDRMAASSST